MVTTTTEEISLFYAELGSKGQRVVESMVDYRLAFLLED